MKSRKNNLNPKIKQGKAGCFYFNSCAMIEDLLTERSLRGSKTKMKVSGQFNKLKSAQYYARKKSYIETEHRFGIESIYLIEKVLEGKPLTIEEMKRYDDLD